LQNPYCIANLLFAGSVSLLQMFRLPASHCRFWALHELSQRPA